MPCGFRVADRTPAHLACGFVLVSVAYHIVNLDTLFCYRLAWYDEGVHINGARAWSEGRVPYADFFFAHPPGILALSRVALEMGLGLVDQRILFWAGGIVLTLLAALLGGRLAGRNGVADPWTTAGLTAVLISSSTILLDASSLLMTDLPAAILIVGSVWCLQGGRPAESVGSGALLAASTLFRVQGLVFLPGLALLILIVHGWRIGARRACSSWEVCSA